MGGFLFYAIEHPNEINQKAFGVQNIRSSQFNLTNYLWQLGRQSHVSEDEWKAESAQLLEQFLYTSFHAYDINMVTWNDLHSNETEAMWTFATAMFFSATLITTIGNLLQAERQIHFQAET